MSQLTKNEAIEGLNDVTDYIRDGIKLLSEISGSLDHPFEVENVVVALQQLINPEMYNRPPAFINPLSDFIAMVNQDESRIVFKHACVGCGNKYDTEGEVEVCASNHRGEKLVNESNATD